MEFAKDVEWCVRDWTVVSSEGEGFACANRGGGVIAPLWCPQAHSRDDLCVLLHDGCVNVPPKCGGE